jgi:hypothetical protein
MLAADARTSRAMISESRVRASTRSAQDIRCRASIHFIYSSYSAPASDALLIEPGIEAFRRQIGLEALRQVGAIPMEMEMKTRLGSDSGIGVAK